MSIKSDFSKENNPTASIAMQHYVFAFVQDVINQPNNLERSKAWLKEYSENEHLNYSELECNLNVFFELLKEYSKTSSPLLYRFLKLQAQTCYINEDRFNLLRISYPYHEFMVETINSSACCQGKNCVSSSLGSGIVGGHIIGL